MAEMFLTTYFFLLALSRRKWLWSKIIPRMIQTNCINFHHPPFLSPFLATPTTILFWFANIAAAAEVWCRGEGNELERAAVARAASLVGDDASVLSSFITRNLKYLGYKSVICKYCMRSLKCTYIVLCSGFKALLDEGCRSASQLFSRGALSRSLHQGIGSTHMSPCGVYKSKKLHPPLPGKLLLPPRCSRTEARSPLLLLLLHLTNHHHQRHSTTRNDSLYTSPHACASEWSNLACCFRQFLLSIDLVAAREWKPIFLLDSF